MRGATQHLLRLQHSSWYARGFAVIVMSFLAHRLSARRTLAHRFPVRGPLFVSGLWTFAVSLFCCLVLLLAWLLYRN